MPLKIVAFDGPQQIFVLIPGFSKICAVIGRYFTYNVFGVRNLAALDVIVFKLVLLNKKLMNQLTPDFVGRLARFL